MTARSPSLVGDVLTGLYDVSDYRRVRKSTFPFTSWAAANRFDFSDEAAGFLANCGSAAEAFFARGFLKREGVQCRDNRAFTPDRTLELQVRASGYYIDAVVSSDTLSLAVEIDGMGFHHRSKEQVAADYIRERRLVLKGYTVIRFTAQEVFSGPAECWRQIEAILTARANGTNRENSVR